MIPDKSTAGTVTSTLPGKRKIKMQVSLDAMPYIMEVLTRLYGDEETAAIREYSTNAWDSHIFAGNTDRPIEVYTPNALSPFLRIKDYGLGMDADDIEETYSQYGESTKRVSADTNGSMGIGGKVALALSNQFTVIGVKDGISTTIAISRDEDGVGQMEIVEESVTDAPNGVEVMVPISSYWGFEDKAKFFFQFWKKGTVLLNGADPTKEFEMVTEHLAVWDGDRDYVVMGNVPYPVKEEFAISRGTGRSVIAFVDMSKPEEKVKFTPPREGLNYNTQTKTVLDMLRAEFTAHIGEYIKAVIDGSTTYTAAIRNFYSLRDDFGGKNVKGLTFKDIDFDTFKNEPKYEYSPGLERNYFAVAYSPSRSRGAVSNRYLAVRSVIEGNLIITGYNTTSIPSPYRARIKQWARTNGVNIGYSSTIYLLNDMSSKLPYFDGVEKVVDWKTLMEETKPDPKERAARVSLGSENYEYLYFDDSAYYKYSRTTGTLDPEDSVVFLSPRWDGLSNDIIQTIFGEDDTTKIVITPANRHNKIKRFIPNAEAFEVNKWAKIRNKAAYDAMTDEDREKVQKANAISQVMGSWEFDRLLPPANVPVDKIADPRYTQMRTWKGYRNQRVEYDYHAQHDPRWADEQKKANAEFKALKFKTLAADYPLTNWSHRDHTIMYINAVFGKDNS